MAWQKRPLSAAAPKVYVNDAPLTLPLHSQDHVSPSSRLTAGPCRSITSPLVK